MKFLKRAVDETPGEKKGEYLFGLRQGSEIKRTYKDNCKFN